MQIEASRNRKEAGSKTEQQVCATETCIGTGERRTSTKNSPARSKNVNLLHFYYMINEKRPS